MKSAQKLASLANKCLMKQPKSRPKMSEVVEILGNIINEIIITTSQQQDSEPEDVMKEEEENREEEEAVSSAKQNDRRRGFDFKEIVSFRNRSIGKLDWRNWTPGLVRTS